VGWKVFFSSLQIIIRKHPKPIYIKASKKLMRLSWEKYKTDLENSGDLFYSWQYDIRWAATELRKSGRMKAADVSPRGIWEI
jgi:hypothetical protein